MRESLEKIHCFSQIWGRNAFVKQLEIIFAENEVKHGYLLLGARGIGKNYIVKTLAKYLLCEQKTMKNRACGVCKSCMALEYDTHPDIIYLPIQEKNSEQTSNEKKSDKKSIGVEEIRKEIVQTLSLAPYYGERKIYILSNAHTMTTQAQNALLKTLEEAPAHAMIFLLAENKTSLLPTILSRVSEVVVPPLSEEELRAYLQQYQKGTSHENFGMLTSYAQGSIGKALELLEDKEFQNMYESVIEKLILIPKLHLEEILLFAKFWDMEYKNDVRLLHIIELWYRDLFVAKLLHQEAFLIQKEKTKEIFSLVVDETKENLILKTSAIMTAQQQFFQNGNFRLILESLLISLKES